jgi:hypothetical protein
MAPRIKRIPARASKKQAQNPLEDQVRSVLTWLERHGDWISVLVAAIWVIMP